MSLAMLDDTLPALLLAYIDGDVIARKALLDWLEEHGDPRVEAVRLEAINWDGVARQLHGWGGGILRVEIDCARVGGEASPRVAAAVREARRKWLRGLFPEVEIPV
jgi:hypothetical protein